MADYGLPEGFIIEEPQTIGGDLGLPEGFELVEEPTGPTPVTGELEQKMTQELSIKEQTLADLRARKSEMDPADYNQQYRDAMRLGIATAGEVGEDLAAAQAYVGAHQAPAQPYKSDVIEPFTVMEPEMEPTLAVLDIVGGLQAKAAKVGANLLYDEAIETLLKAKPGSQAARYMQDLATQGKMTDEKFLELIKDIPEDEQAILLAEGNPLFMKYFKGAIDSSDMTAAKLSARLEMRKGVIDQFTASEEQMNAAIKNFGNMRKTVAAESPASFTTGNIKNNIEALDKIYKTDATAIGTDIRNILLDVGDEMNIDKALDLRENINAMLRKPGLSKNAQGNLENIKNSLDSFIGVSLKDRPDLVKLVDDTLFDYRQVVNDYQLGQLVKKHSKGTPAVDWEKLRVDAKKNKLNSTNIEYAKPILKDFETRFVNDPKLRALAIPSGAGQQNLLSLISRVYSGIIDVGHRILHTDRAHGLVIQNEIRKSINNKNNKYYIDFINDLMDNPKIPQGAKDQVKSKVDELVEILDADDAMGLPKPKGLDTPIDVEVTDVPGQPKIGQEKPGFTMDEPGYTGSTTPRVVKDPITETGTATRPRGSGRPAVEEPKQIGTTSTISPKVDSFLKDDLGIPLEKADDLSNRITTNYINNKVELEKTLAKAKHPTQVMNILENKVMKDFDGLINSIGVKPGSKDAQRIKDIYMLDILKDLQKGCK